MIPNYSPSALVVGFPLPPEPAQGEGIAQYGMRVLTYILSADVVVYGLLSVDDLEAAHYAARYALAAHEILPQAVETITRVQVTITQLLDRRAREQETAEALSQVARSSSPPPANLPGGTKVPTHPRPPAPPQPDALSLPTTAPSRKPEFQF